MQYPSRTEAHHVCAHLIGGVINQKQSGCYTLIAVHTICEFHVCVLLCKQNVKYKTWNTLVRLYCWEVVVDGGLNTSVDCLERNQSIRMVLANYQHSFYFYNSIIETVCRRRRLFGLSNAPLTLVGYGIVAKGHSCHCWLQRFTVEAFWKHGLWQSGWIKTIIPYLNAYFESSWSLWNCLEWFSSWIIPDCKCGLGNRRSTSGKYYIILMSWS